MDFTNLKSTPLEIIESIDMMRLIENGRKVKIVLTENETYSIDVPEDVNKVIEVMKTDQLSKTY